MKFIKSYLIKFNLLEAERNFLNDMDEEFKPIFEKCKDFTMTSVERMYSLYKAVEYVVNNNIKGDFVECGVWRGGSAMIIAHTLLKFGVKDRSIYLYDTFEGMSEPTAVDIDYKGDVAKSILADNPNKVQDLVWCYSSVDEVKKNMYSTDFPSSQIYFIKGKVEDTLPNHLPSSICLLRLDTDWYESTKHELEHLFPILEINGVLIIDDYGCWKGSRKAVDEYFFETRSPILLNRIDSTGRIALKLSK
ncbi:MAG: TylF/MycF/NovP-related O-methyltransferase [Bacteroidota bacterium]